MSHPDASISDPEFDAIEGRVVWQQRTGEELWVARLDLDTGDLVPSDGQGELVSKDVTPIALAKNGPEWMQGAEGPEILFSRIEEDKPLVRRAWRSMDGEWSSQPILRTTFGAAPIGSLDAGDEEPRVIYRDVRTSEVHWTYADGSAVGDLVRDPAYSPRWVPGTHDVTFSYDGAAVSLNVDTQELSYITDESANAGQVFRFWSVETGAEMAMVTDDDAPTELVIYRLEGEHWEPIKWIVPPEDYPYVISPEPFDWRGRTYVSYLAIERPRNGGQDPAEVWVASVEPGDDLNYRVSESLIRRRMDPEAFAGNDTVWIYYTDNDDGHRALRRCETGL